MQVLKVGLGWGNVKEGVERKCGKWSHEGNYPCGVGNIEVLERKWYAPRSQNLSGPRPSVRRPVR